MTTNRRQGTQAKRQAERAERNEALAQSLSDGIDNLSTTEEWRAYLDFQAKFPRYSFCNSLLIMIQCPGATMVMPYGKPDKPGTWMHIGRHAKAGETALRIRKPNFQLIKAEESDDGRPHKVLKGFIAVPVFDISQTEGEPVPEGARLLQGEAPEGLLDKATGYITSLGFRVEFVDTIPGYPSANGITYWGADHLVQIATDGRPTMQQAKTALHEAAHILMHKDQASNGLVELEAESVAYIAGANLGIVTDDYSFGYVLGWSAGDPAKARELIKASGNKIQKAARTILDYFDGSDVGDQDEPAEISTQALAELAA